MRAFFISKGNKMASLQELTILDAQESIISGITEKEDLIRAYEAGATYAGFIFVLTSPYGISIEQAMIIAKDSPIKHIGIFQNSDIDDILYIVEHIELKAVLLNGWETQAFISELRALLPDSIKIMKIAHIKDEAPKMNYKHVDFYLLGGHVGEQLEPNWSLLQNIDLSSVFLSGNWKDNSLLPMIKQRPLGFELNFKMFVV